MNEQKLDFQPIAHGSETGKLNILLVDNSLGQTGLGRGTQGLYSEIKRRIGSKQNIRLENLRSAYSFDFDSSFVRALTTLKSVVHLPRNYDAYHILNQTICYLCFLRSPSILTIWDLAPLMGLHAQMGNWVRDSLYKLNLPFARFADAIICTSEYTRSQGITLLGLRPKRTKIIYPGVDHSIFFKREKTECRKLLGLPEESKIILNVSTTREYKNIPTLYRAFGIILARNPKTQLIRVGSPNPNNPELQELAEQLGISDRILFLKPTDQELAYLYNASDVYVHTSRYEGFGFPVVEAMASGTPVVVSNATSIPEVVGDAGIVLDPNDFEAFAMESLNVLSSKETSLLLSEKGMARSHLFAWDKCAEQTYKIYEELAL